MSVIGNLQQQIADVLSATPFFANITVLTEASGDLINAMERSLGPVTSDGGKSGAFVLVMSPDANQNLGELFGPFFDEIEISIQVTTNINVAADPAIGIGVTDLDICENICNALSLFYPAAANAPLVPQKPTIRLVDRGDTTTTRVCKFKTQGGIRTVPPQAATPAISETTGTITLTCATAGAAMFYTLDGTNPMPLHGTLYTAPFTPGAGLTLKVRAFLAGYLTSQTATTTT
jgi:hypothetical protein